MESLVSQSSLPSTGPSLLTAKRKGRATWRADAAIPLAQARNTHTPLTHIPFCSLLGLSDENLVLVNLSYLTPVSVIDDFTSNDKLRTNKLELAYDPEMVIL